LELAIPSGLKGTISNWHAGDVIDFLKTTVTGVHETGNALTVIYGNNQTESYSLASKELNTEFHLQSDGHGGTDLILLHVVGIAQAQHDAAGHLVLERPGLSDSKAASKKFCAHKRGLFFPFSKLTQGGRG
jgi:hypothetical protein